MLGSHHQALKLDISTIIPSFGPPLYPWSTRPCTWRGRCSVCTWPRLAAQLTPCQDSRGHVQDPFLTKIFSLFPSLLWLSGRPLLGSLRTCTGAKTPPTILCNYFLENPWHLQELWCGLSLVRLEEWGKSLGRFKSHCILIGNRLHHDFTDRIFSNICCGI